MKTKQLLTHALILIAGFSIGWALFGGSSEPDKAQAHDHKESTTWTCSMHPSVEKDEPGQCPICGMDLIKKGKAESTSSQVQFKMTKASESLLNVQTATVKKRKPTHKIRLNGTVTADEDLVQHQTAHFPGRIDKLYVSTTGEYVRDGDKLADLFSPELITAQQELFEAMKNREANPAMFEAAKEKLSLLKLPDAQIQRIIKRGEVQDAITFYADVNGYVLEKNVSYGDHVHNGTVMYEVADLSEVWVTFEAYEQDVDALEVGDTVTFEVGSLPGKTFKAPVTYIDPAIDHQTRVAQVRVELRNPEQRLNPGMFAQGTAHAQSQTQQLVVPSSAVLWTGQRSVVYTPAPENSSANYQYHEVTLGANLGDHYIIQEGLEAGQEVITNANFLLDAEAQLQGKASMMHKPNKKETQMDKEEQSKASAQQDFGAPAAFKEPLSQFLQTYLRLKDTLVAGDAEAAVQISESALERLSAVKMKHLESKAAHQFWMPRKDTLKQALQTVQDQSAIDEQRTAFIPLSKTMIAIVKAFSPLNGDTLYVQHCPMANDNKGADWLSEKKPIRNPYYGDQMLTCGSVTDSIGNK
jgi:Cu(I)/Ag(I) efflux system membrane fusion protein